MYPTETATWSPQSATGIGRTLFPVQIIREEVCGEVAGVGEGGAQGTGLEPKAWRYRDLGMATEQFGRCMGIDHEWTAMRQLETSLFAIVDGLKSSPVAFGFTNH